MVSLHVVFIALFIVPSLATVLISQGTKRQSCITYYYVVVAPPMMFQQTRSSRPIAKLKMVSGHHPTGGVLEAGLSPHRSVRSAGTLEYRMLSSWLGTDRNGGMLRLIASRHDDDDVAPHCRC